MIEEEYIVGIDVGKNGGIAFLSLDKNFAKIFSMPDLFEDFIDLLKQHKIVMAFVEKQQPFPKQGVKSTFILGVQHGKILGVLKTLAIPYEEVSSNTWKKEFSLLKKKKKGGGSKKEKKLLSIEKAISLFPNLKDEIGKHDGKAEALLIAEYGRRKIWRRN